MLSDTLEKKNTEAIALEIVGPSQVQNLQNFISRSTWNTELLLLEHQNQVSLEFEGNKVMLTVDCTNFPKKGKDTAGVAPQYSGIDGKINNSVCVVFLGVVDDHCHVLHDFEMYVPMRWYTEEYEARWDKCHMPEDLTYKSQLTIAIEMINKAYRSGKLDVDWVAFDSAFGRSYEFRHSLPAGVNYFADVPSNLTVYAFDTTMKQREYSGKGKRPTKMEPSEPPRAVKEFALDPAYPWTNVVVGIGSNGPIIIRDKLILVKESDDDGAPGETLWLYIKELDDKEVRYALCRHPSDGDPAEIRKAGTMRWTIEQSFKEMKSCVGMDEYQVRSYPGWRRHTLIALMACSFLTKLSLDNCDDSNVRRDYPIVEKPVILKEYLEAYENMQNDVPMENPNLKECPSSPQQIFTLKSIRKLISPFIFNPSLAYAAAIRKLTGTARAFASHLKSRMVKAAITDANDEKKAKKEARKQAKFSRAVLLVDAIMG
jgi:SRSO17 transposase